MIELRKITEEDFHDVLSLELSEEQQQAKLVAPNVRSLAEAWLYRENEDVFPYAVYNNEELVGFILIDVDEEERAYMIWRMMIDKNHQGKGYGKKLVEKVIEIARQREDMDVLHCNYVVGNDAMKKIVESFGFVSNGFDDEHNEQLMKLDVK